MTKEEASFYLSNMDRKYMEKDMSEALDMAIKALEQEPIKYWIDYNGHVTPIQQPCEDAISREAVLSKLNNELKYGAIINAGGIEKAYEIVNNIPSVTPNLTECEDAISREDKKHIDGFKYWCETNEENGTITIPKFVCDEIVKILDKLLSVTPSRRKGRWIDEGQDLLKEGHHTYRCSECNKSIVETPFILKRAHHYCRYCGAEMESEE